MKLHDLVPNVGSKKNRKRVGRGISAGQGKTAGRGTKGQGSRSGEGGHAYRQGGNLPFFRRLPFMRGEGFTPPNQVFYNEVNLDQLSQFFKADANVTPETLEEAHLLRDSRNPTVVLGRGLFIQDRDPSDDRPLAHGGPGTAMGSHQPFR